MSEINSSRHDNRFVKFIKTGYANFCDVTTFHGYHELYYAKTKFWRCVWLLVVCGAMGITLYQIHRAILTYADQSSITIIQPVNTGELLYPPLDVCYIHWISWVDWPKVLAMNFTKETILTAFSYLKQVYSSTVFDVDKGKEDMIKTMAMNNISSLSELYTTIAKPIPMVMATLGGGFLFDNPPFFHNITFRRTNEEIYLCYTLSSDQILGILKDKMNRSSDIVQSDSTVLNFSLQDPTYSMYTSFLDYNEYNYRVGRWLSSKTNYWLTSLSDYRKNYTGFTFPMRLFPDANTDKFVEISKENDAYDIALTPTVHRQMHTVKDPCIVGSKGIATEHRCKDICKAKLEVRLNKCLTLDLAILLVEDTPQRMCLYGLSFLSEVFNDTNSTQSTTRPKPSTTTTISTIQPNMEEIRADYQSCISDCNSPCEIWKYTFSKSITTLASEARLLSFKNQTDIQITYPAESDVLIMIDADARTWEDFVGNVGGLLGVWTGASIISFFELIYLCFCKENTCNCYRKNMNESVPVPVPELNRNVDNVTGRRPSTTTVSGKSLIIKVAPQPMYYDYVQPI